MAGGEYHEPTSELSPRARDMHRAIQSLIEELEAVDWYAQRAEVCVDPELRAILLHNRAEEIEHASMLLEWLRRRDEQVAKQTRAYLFSRGSITERELDEGEAASRDGGAAPAPAGLGIGSLRNERQGETE